MKKSAQCIVALRPRVKVSGVKQRPEECKLHDNFTATSTQQTTSNKWRKSPIYPSLASTQGDRKKLAQCIAALRPRVKVSRIKQRPEECKSNDIFTATSIQQTTNNKWREPPICPPLGSTQGDRKKPAQCITAPRLRVKVEINIRTKQKWLKTTITKVVRNVLKN